jgi:hypothetical protein
MSRFALLALAASTASTACLHAQGLASPFGSVTQKVDSTTITVSYYRPSVRGRNIFGVLVRWGVTWTPGANWATTFDIDHDVSFEGRRLPKGKYSMWMIPADRPDSWTVILNRSAQRFHTQKPDPSDDQLRLKLPVDSAPHFELLTFSFPVVSHTGATLEFHWAGTVLPMRIEFGITQGGTAAHPWSSYVGSYELRDARDPAGKAFRYDITERGNALWVHTTPDVVEEGLDVEFDLAPAGGDSFHPREYKNGKLVGTELDELISFKLAGNRATGFEIRGIAEAKLLGRGTRVQP